MVSLLLCLAVDELGTVATPVSRSASAFSTPSGTSSIAPSATPSDVFAYQQVPANLSHTNDLTPLRKRAAQCHNFVNPECIQSTYGLPTQSKTHEDNILAIPGFLDEFANKDDLARFLKKYPGDIDISPTFAEESIDGGSNDQDQSKVGAEANLDVQYAVGLTNGNPVTFISSGLAGVQGLLGLFDHISNQQKPPTVLVIPYGIDEDEISRQEAQKMCDQIQELGNRGVSVLAASGDGGVAGVTGDRHCSFMAAFPASCPFVTVVGGTTSGQSPPHAASFSGGGFSNYFPRPSYQDSAVSDYIERLDGHSYGRNNASGRGYPDISALSENFFVELAGHPNFLSGTS